jgi:hypothetical protein
MRGYTWYIARGLYQLDDITHLFKVGDGLLPICGARPTYREKRTLKYMARCVAYERVCGRAGVAKAPCVPPASPES